MRVLLRVLVTVTSVLTALSPAFAGPAHASNDSNTSNGASLERGGHDADADLRYVQRLLYDTSLDDFMAIVGRGDPWFDMSTDLCSAPGIHSTGRTFDFRAACRRHDFGYRNLRLLDRRYSCNNRPPGKTCTSPGRPGRYWNATARRRVDQQFLADMKAHCRSRAWYDEPTCFSWAETFYGAVRLAGGA
jgi:hypothetical protein